MTPEIERLAIEAGITICPGWGTVLADVHRLAKFRALIVEECAKECEGLWGIDGQFTADEFAKAIRAKFARGELKDAAK